MSWHEELTIVSYVGVVVAKTNGRLMADTLAASARSTVYLGDVQCVYGTPTAPAAHLERYSSAIGQLGDVWLTNPQCQTWIFS